MIDLISIGAIGIDIYFKGKSLTHTTDRFELAIGGKYFVDHFYEGLGGGGANVAIGVRRHGLSVALFSEIGNNPFRDIIIKKLEKERVQYRGFCQFERDYINISVIFLNEHGEKTIVNYRNQHQKLLETKKDIDNLKKARAVYLANMPNISLTERIKIVDIAKKNEALTIANLGVKDCRRHKSELLPLLEKIDILIINGHEFADLVKAPYGDIHWHEPVVKYYIPVLKSTLVVVTEGKKGSYAYQDDLVFHQSAIPLDKIADATGAGDGYTAGFIAEYYRQKDIERSMISGAKYAAKILTKIGAN